MKRPNLIDKYDVRKVKKGIPLKYGYRISLELDSRGEPIFKDGYKEYSSHDYLNFIAKTSNGLTEDGMLLLQESIESFVYSILGAQSNQRNSIVEHIKGFTGFALQTQDVLVGWG